MRIFWLTFASICLALVITYPIVHKPARKYIGRHRAPASDEDDRPDFEAIFAPPKRDHVDYGDEPLDDIMRNNQRG